MEYRIQFQALLGFMRPENTKFSSQVLQRLGGRMQIPYKYRNCLQSTSNHNNRGGVGMDERERERNSFYLLLRND
jgi:hypothetical protein